VNQLEKIVAPVKSELKTLEKRINSILRENVFNEKFTGTFLNKGKKLRPIFLFLLARALGYRENDIVDYGIIVELLHNASLVHDDIIDHSLKRRGESTFNALYGNNIAVLLGDLLFLFSNKLAVEKRKFEILDILVEKNENLLIGEIEEGLNAGNVSLTEDEYMKIIKNKTASLFELVGEIACLLTNKKENDCEAIKGMSSLIGLSFQIIDDILDYTSEVKKVGKPVMNDLREKTLTLPIIYAMKKSYDLKEKVEKFFSDVSNDTLLYEIRDGVVELGGLKYAKEKALEMMKQTRGRIDKIPPSVYKDSLLALVDFIVKRSF